MVEVCRKCGITVRAPTCFLGKWDCGLTYSSKVAEKRCDSVTGEVWPAVEGGGPQGTLPPHKYNLYFKEGGVGTFLPLYFRFVE
jgi:hypothetical protein